MRHLSWLLILVLTTVVTAAEDHSEYFSEPFDTPQEVTATCLECHDDVGESILHTRHWNWQGSTTGEDGSEQVVIGKQNLINNFCISVPSNWPRCTSCHIGYGWQDASFDHSDPGNIDCLVCHDATGTYKKVPTGAGMPDPSVDLLAVAQSVGSTPSRTNCGTCHFDGGGGTGVKHGDMDDMLYEPTRELDVHMGGLDFVCVDCHTTEDHRIPGASHGSMTVNENHISCTDCHDDPELHDNSAINRHLNTLACETCHIPEYARGLPTKTWWDWSQAGEDREAVHDEYGKETYNKKKGEFAWGKDLVPTYAWSNGGASVCRIGDTIDPTAPVALNQLQGGFDDPESRIRPYKVMRGKQPYDAVNYTMIVPHLFGPEGYWKTFDWERAAEIGMASVGQDFSGEVGFVETEMYWPLNHTVAPKEDALRCTVCHIRGDRLDWTALGYDGDPMKTKQKRLESNED
ncbi:tetrathionate reductase family octaheme c-type cytochrome [bacterium]|nr:tetrathionate reductase family octaheme c-type cytochrome [bacterium]